MREDENTLNDLIAILRRRLWIIIGVGILIFLPISIITFLLPSVYQAETTVVYMPSKEASVMNEFTPSLSSMTKIPNLIEEIKSRSLSEEVASELPINIKKQFKLPKNHNSEDEDKAIAGMIRKNITVSSIRGTDILKISFQSHSPEVASFIANKIVSVIQKRNLEYQKGEIKGVKAFIEKQLKIFSNQLRCAEDSLKQFKEKYGGMIVDTLGNIESNALKGATESEVSYNETRTARAAAEARLNYIKGEIQKLNSNIIDTTTSLSQNAVLIGLKNKLFSLETQYQSLLLKGYDETHPEVKRIKSEIEEARNKYRDVLLSAKNNLNIIDPYSRLQMLVNQSVELEADIVTYRAKENALKKLMADYDRQMAQMPSRELRYARLLRRKNVNEKIYTMLLEKNEETRITEASKVASIRVLDPAIEPTSPIKPKKKLNLFIGLILSLILAIGAGFIAEGLDTSIKGIDDVEKYLGISVLASIPSIKTKGKKGEVEEIEERLVTHYKPRTPVSEAYRSLRTNLQFASVDGPIKTVVITSPAPREGKTLTASNLAITEAQAGLKTLLLDTDMRKPMIHNLFNLEKEEGLSRVLAGELKLDDVIKKTEVENLFVITSGSIPPNPSELLGSKRMEEVLDKLKTKFDIIIMDSPPIIAVTDPIVLGQKADGIIMVIRSNMTIRGVAERAKGNVEYAKIKILGSVLNDVNVKWAYGSYRYYYYYHYYSDEEGKKKKRRIRHH